MLKSIAFAAALTLAAGSSAFAQTVSADLQAPVAKPIQVIAGGAVWSCEGSTCIAPQSLERTISVDSCRELGRTVGAVASLGGAQGLSTHQLTRCNAGFKSAATLTAQASTPTVH